MKRSFLTRSFFGYLVFTSSSFVTAADLVSQSRRPAPSPAPYTIIISTADEVRLLKAQRTAGTDLPTVVQLNSQPKSAGPMKIEFQRLDFDVLVEDQATHTEDNKPQVIHSTYNDPEGLKAPESILDPGSPSDDASMASEPPAAPEPLHEPGVEDEVSADQQMIEAIKQSFLNDVASKDPATRPGSADKKNEHDIHQPLKLPEAGAVPNVDLKNDPVYNELLKVFKDSLDESAEQESDSETDTGESTSEESDVDEELNDESVIDSELIDAQFHAAEELLRVARSLEKPAKKLKKKDFQEEADKLREAISKMREIASELASPARP